jgi:hypothetical protein
MIGVMKDSWLMIATKIYFINIKQHGCVKLPLKFFLKKKHKAFKNSN